jgi:quinol monooxygenase YgiN
LLEGLAGRIPGLLKIEVGINFIADPNAADVVLYSEFIDAAALAVYQAHPLHLEVVPQVKALAVERRSADYLI